ncbi:NaeI family type II restriction endonuclease [Streptomyces gardneri]|uniref:NaeI family type II restriction endonuclease n=1 Tax=Streptomyces gardneri TaxID=66892 RepID=UPI0035DF2E2F
MERRRRGGQWSEPDPELSEPMREIVSLLRGLIDLSGIRLKGVRQRLLEEHESGPRPPSYHVLSERLRGRGLRNNPWLIYAIIAAVAPAQDQEALNEQVQKHLSDNRAAPTTTQPQEQRGSTPGTHAVPAERELLDTLRRNQSLDKKVKLLEARLARRDKEVQSLKEQLAKASRQPAAPPPEGRPATERKASTGTAADGHTTPGNPAPATGSASGPSPADASAVADALRAMPHLRTVTGTALRDAFDSVLDGPRTGRFDPATLGKAEKSFLDSRATLTLLRAWGFQPGDESDALIAGQDVTLKFTAGTTWTVTPGQIGRVCLLVSADDHASTFSLGVLRIGPEHVSRAANRDFKRTLSVAGRQAITWILRDAPLPENTLLHLPEQLRAQIFATEPGRGSAARTHTLFGLVQGRILSRTTVATVAMTSDYPRRIRDAQRELRRSGIVVLGGRESALARGLGLPAPSGEEWISQRLTRLRPHQGHVPHILLAGEPWTVAGPDDPVEEIPSPFTP